MAAFSTQQIADRVGGELLGRGDLAITGVEQLDRAVPGQISFIRDAKFAAGWAASKASAAVISFGVDLEPDDGRALIRVADADLALSVVLEMFAPPPPRLDPGVHGTAVVHDTATLGQAVAIGPHTVIGGGCVIGDGCVIHANVTILDESRIGDGTVIWPGVVIRERCEVGCGCILHPNVTIGADGFGYRRAADGQGVVKVPQIGTVKIGDSVEIGAGTTIDRGKFSATVIGDGTKIDNLCLIAHNCRIGRCCILAGQVGLAGSVTVGDGVVMGGKVAVRDQVTIGPGAQLAAAAAVRDDVPAGASWAGYPARDARAAFREWAAIRKLPDLVRARKKKD
ncbi:MAG: UDP-3-O-(3-hydroxymyristoyl)glucosamine N-acyltransferase [Phycisphaeraceae bacterium]